MENFEKVAWASAHEYARAGQNSMAWEMVVAGTTHPLLYVLAEEMGISPPPPGAFAPESGLTENEKLEYAAWVETATAALRKWFENDPEGLFAFILD